MLHKLDGVVLNRDVADDVEVVIRHARADVGGEDADFQFGEQGRSRG